MVTEKQKRIRRISLIPIIITVMIVLFFLTIFNPANEPFNQLKYSRIFEQSPSNLILHLNHFPLEIQTNAHSSGFTVISMVSSYLGRNLSEQDVMDQFLKKEKRNLYPSSFLYYLRYNLPGYHLSLINPTNRNTFLGIVIDQLRKGFPIPILISSTNHKIRKRRMTLNYAVIIGYNKRKKQIELATTFGFFQYMTVFEIMQALDHRNLTRRPILFRIVEKLNLYHINNIFRIQKDTSTN